MMIRRIPEKLDGLTWNGEELEERRGAVVELSPNFLIYSGRPFKSEAKDECGNNTGVGAALEEAVKVVGSRGIIASLPYLIAAKVKADSTNYLNQHWFTALSEENVGIDTKGKFVNKGKPVVLIVHGGGSLTHRRISQAYGEDGLTNLGFVRYDEGEFDALVAGQVQGRDNLHYYSIDDVFDGKIIDPFARFGIWLDYETAVNTLSQYQQKDRLVENPLAVARAASIDNLGSLFDAVKNPTDNDVRNSHLLDKIDPSQPQAYFLVLDIECGGIMGTIGVNYHGCFAGAVSKSSSQKE